MRCPNAVASIYSGQQAEKQAKSLYSAQRGGDKAVSLLFWQNAKEEKPNAAMQAIVRKAVKLSPMPIMAAESEVKAGRFNCAGNEEASGAARLADWQKSGFMNIAGDFCSL